MLCEVEPQTALTYMTGCEDVTPEMRVKILWTAITNSRESASVCKRSLVYANAIARSLDSDKAQWIKVTESARSYFFSKEVIRENMLILVVKLTFWLLTFWLLTSRTALRVYMISKSVFTLYLQL